MSLRPFAFARRNAKTPPPDETFKEAEYLKALGERQKVISVKLLDGQVLRGWIEYYDQNMIRLTREGEPNLFIFKSRIAYISEDGRKPSSRRPERVVVTQPLSIAAPSPGRTEDGSGAADFDTEDGE